MVGPEQVTVVAIGQVDGAVITYLAAALAEVLEQRVGIAHIRPDAGAGFDARRHQYSAESIMCLMRPGPGERMLGVVDLDVYVPPMKYVVGLADWAARRALVALPRLRRPDDPREECFLGRLVAEAAHQIGRTYHAEDPSYIRAVLALCGRLNGGSLSWPVLPDMLPGDPCQDGFW